MERSRTTYFLRCRCRKIHRCFHICRGLFVDILGIQVNTSVSGDRDTTLTGRGCLRGRPRGRFAFGTVTAAAATAAMAAATFAFSDGSLVWRVATMDSMMEGDVKSED